MTYPEVLANARTCIGQYCKACPVCNGVACKNQIPGPGAKGVGDTAIRNYNKWAEIWFLQATPLHTGQALQYCPMHWRALFKTSA